MRKYLQLLAGGIVAALIVAGMGFGVYLLPHTTFLPFLGVMLIGSVAALLIASTFGYFSRH
jgi:hypothetical protein